LAGAFATVATGLAFQVSEQFAFILIIAFVGTMNPSIAGACTILASFSQNDFDGAKP
jgi:hypothetical protein